jgi:hypothetical protein
MEEALRPGSNVRDKETQTLLALARQFLQEARTSEVSLVALAKCESEARDSAAGSAEALLPWADPTTSERNTEGG